VVTVNGSTELNAVVGTTQSNDAGTTDESDFHNYQRGSLHGLKFLDSNGNGLLDGTDAGMGNITIQLQGDINGDGTSDTTTTVTDSNGKFQFLNLEPGVYTVTELFTDGINYATTVDHDGNGIGDNTSTVTVGSGDELSWLAGEATSTLIPGQQEVVVGSKLMFGNVPIGDCGLSPGFWANHLYLWDGIALNGPTDGQGVFLASKLAPDTVLAPDIVQFFPGSFDVDGDGHKDLLFTDPNGPDLIIEWDDAQALINASTIPGGDKLPDMIRMGINTFLNDIGIPDFNAPNGTLADFADWIISFGSPLVTSIGGGNYVLNFNNATEAGPDGFPSGTKVKANSPAWTTGDADTPSGADLFATLAGLICDDSNSAADITVSSDQSIVLVGICYPDYFGADNALLNSPGNYINLV
jgi:uncharacterized protein (DUF2141 family)